MASGSSAHSNHDASSSSWTDLAANSSLTATASEFIPGSANRNKHLKKTKNSRSNGPGTYKNNVIDSVGESSGNSSKLSERHVGRMKHQSNSSSSPGGYGHQSSNDSVTEIPSFKPSPEPSKLAVNNKEYNRGRRDWRNQSGVLHDSEKNQGAGAVGGQGTRTYFFKNNAPCNSKDNDRNGNRGHDLDQSVNQTVFAGKPRFRERGDQGYYRSHKKDGAYDVGADNGQDRSKNRDRGAKVSKDDTQFSNFVSREWKAHNRLSGQDAERDDDHPNKYHSNYSSRRYERYDRQHNDQGWDNQYSDRYRGDQGRDARSVPRYQDDQNRDGRFSLRFREDQSWDAQHADRRRENQNRDVRYPERPRDGQNCSRNSDRHEDYNYNGNDGRHYERSHGSHGGRYQDGSFREHSDRHRNSSLQNSRFQGQNFNTQETFDTRSSMTLLNNEKCAQSKETYGHGDKRKETRGTQSITKYSMRDGDDVSQRERLTEQLSRGTLECLVCCDRVRQYDSVWSCSNCYHVLHLKCVIKWAESSKDDCGWRCPACQNVSVTMPSKYRCFCGKAVDPPWNRMDTPHTCGEVCGRSRESLRPLCVHRCTLLCHPGPCPPCTIQVTRSCGCGKISQTVKCGREKPLLCESICGKELNCSAHFCTVKCHSGPCEPCQQKIEQECFCKKQKREVDCIPENQGILKFCCSDVCGHDLSCGNHKCKEQCHDGDCKPCHLTPDVITHCPCGQTELSTNPEEKRKSCVDPIPVCGKICGKKLSCGQPSNPHTCKATCHSGTCPPCQLTTLVRCRCGHMDRELPCEQLTSKADDARCEKKCTKKRSCGKHKCNQLCCIEIEHPCPLPCNHTLTCGLHRCEQLCHRGHCRPCWRTSFEELHCECGGEIMFPPVPCGTKPPPCSRPCSRQHDCEHDALHNCHSEPNCPPCTVLTQKYCHGSHELRKSIPCHQKEFSCGLSCNKSLPCGRHKCIQTCHKGDCVRTSAICSQPCTIPRRTCQHPCSAPCHDGKCPETPCKEMVRVTCECGHRSAMRPCAENTKEYQRIATSLLASKMADVQLGHSIDIGDIMGNASTKKLYLKNLDCNEECKVIERNRRLAIGLQIQNPDLSQKLTPRYSEFMRGWAKKDPAFCHSVHDKLTELVKLSKESKQKSRSYSFEVMNREKRQFVHEYCEHFGCESVAYDQEPKRNVVATAQKAKAWLPSVGLVELVQRETGVRKVPGPMLNSVKKPVNRSMDTLSNKWALGSPLNEPSSTNPSQSSPVSSGSFMASQAQDLGLGVSTSGSYIDHFNS